MLALILVSVGLGKLVAAVGITALLATALLYSFRGKVAKAEAAAGADIQKAKLDVKAEVKKL